MLHNLTHCIQEEKAFKGCTFKPDTRETKLMTKRLIPGTAGSNVAESLILRGLERRAKTEVRLEVFVFFQGAIFCDIDIHSGSNGNDSNGTSGRRAA